MLVKTNFNCKLCVICLHSDMRNFPLEQYSNSVINPFARTITNM